MSPRYLSFENIRELAPIVSGELKPDCLTLFSTMKNEMDFLPAWLDHHRKIGFQQFLIWDDNSIDGSGSYLVSQKDVVVLRSKYSFGDAVAYLEPDGTKRSVRFGTYVKVAAPHVYLPNKFSAYLDADEFLILPDEVSSIADIVEALKANGETSILASLIEFFPSSLDSEFKGFPDSFEKLLEAYPYFEAEPLLIPEEGKSKPKFLSQSKTAKLYQEFNVSPPLVRKGWHKFWMPRKVKADQRAQTSPRHKTPLILRTSSSWQVGSHNSSKAPASDRWLAIAHFVFTHRLRDKAAAAIKTGAHAHGGRKYYGYAQILKKSAHQANGLLSKLSVKYSGAKQLAQIGLMRWY